MLAYFCINYKHFTVDLMTFILAVIRIVSLLALSKSKYTSSYGLSQILRFPPAGTLSGYADYLTMRTRLFIKLYIASDTTEITKLWNGVKNSYRYHAHKRQRSLAISQMF